MRLRLPWRFRATITMGKIEFLDWVQRESLRVLKYAWPQRQVTLYGPDNKPIYLPAAVKVGVTYNIRKPQWYCS